MAFRITFFSNRHQLCSIYCSGQRVDSPFSEFFLEELSHNLKILPRETIHLFPTKMVALPPCFVRTFGRFSLSSTRKKVTTGDGPETFDIQYQTEFYASFPQNITDINNPAYIQIPAMTPVLIPPIQRAVLTFPSKNDCYLIETF